MAKNKNKCALPGTEKMMAFFVEYTLYVRKNKRPNFFKATVDPRFYEHGF